MIEFLKPSIREIRKSIIDIDDSYNNDWDILAELLQNSVDAIKKEKPNNPQIIIEVDSINQNISVQDNGNGIENNELPRLLAPFSTNKENDEESIGEKGVGLTFVIFSCNHFHIKTGTKNSTTIGEIKDAYNWKKSLMHDPILLQISEDKESFQGTKINLINVKESPIFKLSTEQLGFVLRTKTAIGNTNALWDENSLNIEVILQHKDLNGNYSENIIPYKYQLIYENLDKNSKIDLDDFINYANEADRTDIDKRRKLQDKVIFKNGTLNHNGRKIKYTTCFVPKRKVWNDLSVESNLCSSQDLESNEWLDEFYYTIFSEGIFTSVKGMPTGISIEHPTTGYAGYWSNIFILFEDKHLKFDIGRKSIHGMTAKIYKNFSREIFNDYLKYITKYVSGEVTINSEWDKDEIFGEIDNLIDLKSPHTKFIKNPKDQEASVSAIFYELIGNNKITDIVPLVAGYRNKYDLYAKWGHKKLVFEIKSKLKNVLKDFNDEQKMFDEIDCIVCWNVSDEDNQAMKNRGITLESLELSTLSSSVSKIIPNSTHKLILSGFVAPIYVIDLKTIIEK